MGFPDRLRSARELNGLTQEQAAVTFRVSKNTYIAWESGKSEPRLSCLLDISFKFGVSVNFLATGSDLWRPFGEPEQC